jgi:hypothetical protein
MNAHPVVSCSFRENGYYALRLRDGIIDVRRCEWNDILNGIDIYDANDDSLQITLIDPRWFDRLYEGRVTTMPKVIESEAVR